MSRRDTNRLGARRLSTRVLSGLVVLVGVALVLATGSVWPWIIAVIGLASVPYAAERGGLLGASLLAGWLVALTAIIDRGVFWPGILVLVVALFVLRAVIVRTDARRAPGRAPARRKRR